MLTLKRLPTGIYHLTQYSHTFYRAKVEHWFYDLENKLISEKESFPDTLETRTMTAKDLDWFNDYYIKLLKG